MKNVVHLGQAVDETAALAHWHLPEAHFLEAWGDCRSSDGTASVVQPLIEPLFGGRSAVELLGLLASGEDKPGHDLVRETWTALLPAGAAPSQAPPAAGADAATASNTANAADTADTAAGDASAPVAGSAPAVAVPTITVDTDAWNKVLHDGLLAGSALPPAAVGLAPVPAAALAPLAAPAPLPASSWCSGPRRRCTTDASPTSPGSRSCPTPSPSSPGATPPCSPPKPPSAWASPTRTACG